jgi:ABC-type sugar transport system ATPase subunit
MKPKGMKVAGEEAKAAAAEEAAKAAVWFVQQALNLIFKMLVP